MAGDPIGISDYPTEVFDPSIVFRALEDGSGLRVIDTIERRQYTINTPSQDTLNPVDPGKFQVPVDGAVRITTSRLELPDPESIFIHNQLGEPVTHLMLNDKRSFPADHYLIDISTSVKLYLRVHAPMTVTAGSNNTTIEFTEPTPVTIGARSFQRQPSGTITTTTALDDLRTAVSALSSALKTTSPERSFATLRGHPPLIELGDELSVPAGGLSPDTGITLEVHRSCHDLFVAAPLAFYLGAEITWGERRLQTNGGFTHSLSQHHDFEISVERALKQVFLLDCITRTEGIYQVSLHERREFEARCDTALDFASLYDQSPGARLESYLSVPHEAIADLVPAWNLMVYLDPEPDAVTYLPFLLNNLSTIRTRGQERFEVTGQKGARQVEEPTSGMYRSTQYETIERQPESGPYLVLPDSESALTSMWIGEGVPLGATKGVYEGFEHRLRREPAEDDISILVVCNDAEMLDERDSVDDIYGSRREMSFDVTVETDVSTSRLRRLLKRDTDFLHYIGHVDGRGFQCRDGWFDAARCREVGASVFLLNSCDSYEQGVHLIRSGSIAGIVTVTDVINQSAAAIGETVAQFLNNGFPLYAALDAAKETHLFGKAYALLGDGHITLTQPTTTIPEYLDLEDRVGEQVTVTHRTFTSPEGGLGAYVCPPYEDGDRYYLLGGEIASLDLSVDEVEGLLQLSIPVRDGGDLRFSLPENDASGS